MKQQIESVVKSAISASSFPEVPVLVVTAQDSTHGDYASNVAFSLAKTLKKSPKDVAQEIVSKLRASEIFEKVEVAGAGFINFTLTDKKLLESLGEKFVGKFLQGQKVMIEFTDPNPFKEFHIGHLYSNIVGESIARLYESTGAEVRRVNYQGDVGLHVAKALWGLQQQIANGIWQIEDLENKDLEDRAKILGEAYALGASAYEEDKVSKEEIIEINKEVYAGDASIMELYKKGRQWSLDYFESIYKRLMDPKKDQAFDRYYFESEAGPIGLQIVKENPQVFKESEGAIVFPGEDYGLHTRVFINSLGLPTYEAKELGLAVTKYKEYPFDLAIIVTGNEINEYFKVLLKAISFIKPEIAEKMRHLSHGMVRLADPSANSGRSVKMSSRTGNVVTGEWLLGEAVKRAGEKIKETERGDLSSEIAENVGVGAVKWALLKSSIGKDIEFSFDESISFEGNSGPYIQYTFVRTQSILAKAESGERPLRQAQGTHPFESEERALLVALTRYEDIKREAAEKCAPHLITTYLFELAQIFNNFYQKHPILKAEKKIMELRLELTAKVGETIHDGLYLLGIKTPERM